MSDEFYKLPRLYSEQALASQADILLPDGQAHYLRHVMRRADGDRVRLFDGKNGEFLASLAFEGKKKVRAYVQDCIRLQQVPDARAILIFAPLAKARMDMVIEKTTELGVSDFMPVLTNRTEHRKVNPQRLQAQIIEACEQAERLTLPRLHDLVTLPQLIARWVEADRPNIQWCCERDYADRQPLSAQSAGDQAYLVGPVGGFDEDECALLRQASHVVPISLGDAVLRAETASIMCLSAFKLSSL